MIKTFADALMSAEADDLCNAEYGQVSDERVNHRNGYPAGLAHGEMGGRTFTERAVRRSREPRRWTAVPRRPAPQSGSLPEPWKTPEARWSGRRSGPSPRRGTAR
jgi:hypothetical protein